MRTAQPRGQLFSRPIYGAEPGRAKRSPYIWGGKKGEFRNWGPFLESPENFSGPKNHSKNYDLLIL